MKYIRSYFLVNCYFNAHFQLFHCDWSFAIYKYWSHSSLALHKSSSNLSNSNCMKQKLVHVCLEALFLITHINKTNTDRARISRCGQGAMSCYYCYYCYMQLIHNIHAYGIVSYRRPHNHEGDFVGSKVDFYVSKLKKGCRDEATPIPSIYDQELEALRNADRDDSVKDMIRQIPTFQSCKSVLYRSRGKTMPTTPQEINLQDPNR